MNKLSTHLVNQGFFWQPDAEMYTNTSRWFLNCVSDLKKLSENVRPPNRLGANTGPLMKMDGIFRSYVKFRWCTPQKSSKKREEKKKHKNIPLRFPYTSRWLIVSSYFFFCSQLEKKWRDWPIIKRKIPLNANDPLFDEANWGCELKCGEFLSVEMLKS